MTRDATEREVSEAEKRVGAMLEKLEEETNSEVEKIALEDVVDTNTQTGRPEVQKAVDIRVKPKVQRKWTK
ncbi:hypothetical protein [Acidovorax sp. NCPPB 3576]|uniref:hypothetical protein n=1 Tax=Acidovorax sp. NCPPB 3576 TaxID=2940488 RepID=UPI00234B2D86|nr:hypothetical protein [Acidovorax sp. NCPPB 3576]WCM86980.1 hypothetical protein M5C98_16595 [Acidovorax sp. NCPPB 3576]